MNVVLSSIRGFIVRASVALGVALGLAFAGRAQSTQPKIEAAQLRTRLQQPDLPDTLRVLHQVKLSNILAEADVEAARTYANQALVLARRIKYSTGEALSLQALGKVELLANNPLAAHTSYVQAMALNQRLGHLKNIGDCLVGFGNEASAQEKYERALQYYAEADSVYRRLQPRCLLCEAELLALVANRNEMLNRFAKADQTNRRLLVLVSHRDSTFAGVLVSAYKGVATAMWRTQHYDSALVLVRKGVELAHRTGNKAQESNMLSIMAQGHYILGNMAEAERYAQRAAYMARASGQKAQLATALSYLAAIMHKLNRPGAYDTLLSFEETNNAHREERYTKALVDAQTRYDVAGQQAKLKRQALTMELARLRTRQERASLGVLALLLLVGASGLFWRYRHHQAQRQTTAATRLRHRLAADLHDDVGNLLTQISMQSSLLREAPGSPEQLLARLDQLTATSRQAAQHMTDVVWGLNQTGQTLPELLDRMRDHAHEVLYPLGIEVDFEASPDVADAQLPAEALHSLYLIYKESLHNVVKHAQATRITVRLSHSPTGLRITIADNGRGHDGSLRPDGHGLRNMQARAQAVGGSVQYQRGDTGFAVVAVLPT